MKVCVLIREEYVVRVNIEDGSQHLSYISTFETQTSEIWFSKYYLWTSKVKIQFGDGITYSLSCLNFYYQWWCTLGNLISL